MISRDRRGRRIYEHFEIQTAGHTWYHHTYQIEGVPNAYRTESITELLNFYRDKPLSEKIKGIGEHVKDLDKNEKSETTSSKSDVNPELNADVIEADVTKAAGGGKTCKEKLYFDISSDEQARSSQKPDTKSDRRVRIKPNRTANIKNDNRKTDKTDTKPACTLHTNEGTYTPQPTVVRNRRKISSSPMHSKYATLFM